MHGYIHLIYAQSRAFQRRAKIISPLTQWIYARASYIGVSENTPLRQLPDRLPLYCPVPISTNAAQ